MFLSGVHFMSCQVGNGIHLILVLKMSQPHTLRTQLFHFKLQKTDDILLSINDRSLSYLLLHPFESNYKSIITKIILNIVIVIANHFRVLTSCHSEHFLDVPDNQQT